MLVIIGIAILVALLVLVLILVLSKWQWLYSMNGLSVTGFLSHLHNSQPLEIGIVFAVGVSNYLWRFVYSHCRVF
jgi:hypothetical protein